MRYHRQKEADNHCAEVNILLLRPSLFTVTYLLEYMFKRRFNVINFVLKASSIRPHLTRSALNWHFVIQSIELLSDNSIMFFCMNDIMSNNSDRSYVGLDHWAKSKLKLTTFRSQRYNNTLIVFLCGNNNNISMYLSRTLMFPSWLCSFHYRRNANHIEEGENETPKPIPRVERDLGQHC